MDFEKPLDADRATALLQQKGIQAQMAKVRESSVRSPFHMRVFYTDVCVCRFNHLILGLSMMLLLDKTYHDCLMIWPTGVSGSST